MQASHPIASHRIASHDIIPHLSAALRLVLLALFLHRHWPPVLAKPQRLELPLPLLEGLFAGLLVCVFARNKPTEDVAAPIAPQDKSGIDRKM